ncbi:hypothetical protein [uncultured Kriegella sp.]|uniref:hypothetical protein n=1 Tax=uncultured Kriegella sp. TaxID=1798910 RepID=UPI0030D9C203|tara:strand:- start:32703 stop:33497 length:795 start_codon:yes stop_codon:yes gene_type:complete
MEDNRIGEIVRKAFEKAQSRSTSKAKSALAKVIADEITEKYIHISAKTLERAHDRYINNKIIHGEPAAESVDLFCKYLGYQDYKEYVGKNPIDNNQKRDDTTAQETVVKESPIKEVAPRRKKWKLSITISIVFGAIILITLLSKTADNHQISAKNRCMTWAKTHYEEIACNKSPYSAYGTKVVPFDPVRFSNFKKVEVTMATTFFAEATNRPLVWYYKNKKGEIEYFTAPGLHPITGKTLDEITPYIIEKYVPIHSNAKSSFLE